MKKSIIIMMSLLSVLLISSCSAAEGSEKETTSLVESSKTETTSLVGSSKTETTAPAQSPADTVTSAASEGTDDTRPRQTQKIYDDYTRYGEFSEYELWEAAETLTENADFAALRLQSVGVAFNRDVVDVVAFNDFDEDAFYEKLDELGLDRGMFFIKATDREGGVT